jgi:hypothetical protein
MNMPLSEHALKAENSGWIKDGSCDGEAFLRDESWNSRIVSGDIFKRLTNHFTTCSNYILTY